MTRSPQELAQTILTRRYGIKSSHRLPYAIKLRWPFRSPLVVTKLHRFDYDPDGELAEDGIPRNWHSSECWCRKPPLARGEWR